MTDTFERLTEILIKDYKLSADKLTPDALLEELGIDSLGTVELLWSVEDAFDIKLPTEPVPLTTLGDVVSYIDQLIAKQRADTPPLAAGMPKSPETPNAPEAPQLPDAPTA